MAEGGASRRLAAILAADVVGYSRMMAADEAGTLAALKRHREAVFDPNISRHHGRVVKLMGDGTLAEFGSVVDAVACALAIQRGADPKITLRIGINLGDVIIDGDDIYGDGVNIAARLEPLSDAGGICIASIVHESVSGRVDATFVDAGETRVKNIDRPIRVWKWAPDGRKLVALPKPTMEQPSIAVLPFANMSGDPEQEYFADGITEDIITDLSKVPGLMVIARNSSFVYKGKHVDIPTVARELRVKAVLEGSIRRVGNRVRITAQLIDGQGGGHIWAERFDRDLTDIFAVQDEVTREIVGALKIKLAGALPSSSDTGTSNIEAQDAYFRARAVMGGAILSREIFARGVELYRRAIELDPDFARPYAWLSVAYVNEAVNDWTKRGSASLVDARRAAEIAVAKAPADVHGYAALAFVNAIERNFAECRRLLDHAFAINPKHPLALTIHAMLNLVEDNAERAIVEIEAVMKLDPAWAHGYLQHLGFANLLAGKYETAEALFRERILIVPNTDVSRGSLAVALGFQGRAEEARAAWADLYRVNPAFDFETHISMLPLSPGYAAKLREGLAKAGISP
ncbi:MAG TPA: adenylate/guanylate cyclase domain-containing protein [Bauldia sp.]|nr:adenylate/guanylate cyclase domain-containing protein [Bauldia sp.]